ncbi:hypothetical protein KKC88_03755 [Patescibacteria group bacterium]|nr:hypothetical protein [Patescibacteria group bacterium]MBU1673378.1 hypothetical protein [Patescibacteria group bacterium]MBU1963454.1 hypothetical protein [Patescibacteria group bacterium]
MGKKRIMPLSEVSDGKRFFFIDGRNVGSHGWVVCEKVGPSGLDMCLFKGRSDDLSREMAQTRVMTSSLPLGSYIDYRLYVDDDGNLIDNSGIKPEPVPEPELEPEPEPEPEPVPESKPDSDQRPDTSEACQLLDLKEGDHFIFLTLFPEPNLRRTICLVQGRYSAALVNITDGKRQIPANGAALVQRVPDVYEIGSNLPK